MTRELVLEKATKNTYVYHEELKNGETPVAPVIYIKKEALPTKPQRIRVTVEEVAA
jgi:hypothetical protein